MGRDSSVWSKLIVCRKWHWNYMKLSMMGAMQWGVTVFHGHTACIQVQVSFAHHKPLYVEDSLYCLEQWAFQITQKVIRGSKWLIPPTIRAIYRVCIINSILNGGGALNCHTSGGYSMTWATNTGSCGTTATRRNVWINSVWTIDVWVNVLWTTVISTHVAWPNDVNNCCVSPCNSADTLPGEIKHLWSTHLVKTSVTNDSPGKVESAHSPSTML